MSSDWKNTAKLLSGYGLTTWAVNRNDDTMENVVEKKQIEFSCGHWFTPFYRFCPHCGRVVIESNGDGTYSFNF